MNIKYLSLCIGILGVFSLLLPSFGYSYFEYKFRCTVQGSSIGISLDSGQYCFDYLNDIYIQISPLKQDIENAQSFLDQGEDAEYWNGIIQGLQANIDILENQQRVILTSMKDFESTLFMQVKQLLQRPITAEKQQLLSRINIMRETMETTKKQGAKDTYTLIVTKMENLQYRLFVMDRMLFASDFEEIVPFVKEYLSWRD